ncbi:MAG: hypothetical protein LBD68_09450 [Zoogloeaceae bacterium]|jgi:hypothetical protein|nr:hypothetical protein [Zoogloeaceae bacterium]
MGFFSRVRAIPSGDPAWDEQEFAVDDPRIPAPIRASVLRDWQPGDRLYFIDTKEGGEWWLLDERGELIEVYWLEA